MEAIIMAKKANVDKDMCIGCGACTGICPTVFALDDEGKAVSQVEEVSADDEASAEEAAASCPVSAITVD